MAKRTHEDQEDDNGDLEEDGDGALGSDAASGDKQIVRESTNEPQSKTPSAKKKQRTGNKVLTGKEFLEARLVFCEKWELAQSTIDWLKTLPAEVQRRVLDEYKDPTAHVDPSVVLSSKYNEKVYYIKDQSKRVRGLIGRFRSLLQLVSQTLDEDKAQKLDTTRTETTFSINNILADIRTSPWNDDEAFQFERSFAEIAFDWTTTLPDSTQLQGAIQRADKVSKQYYGLYLQKMKEINTAKAEKKRGQETLGKPGIQDPEDSENAKWVDTVPDGALMITGLPSDADQDLVEGLLYVYGTCVQCEMKDGAALIEMESEEVAHRVVDGMNGATPDGLDEPVSVKLGQSQKIKMQRLRDEAIRSQGRLFMSEHSQALAARQKSAPSTGPFMSEHLQTLAARQKSPPSRGPFMSEHLQTSAARQKSLPSIGPPSGLSSMGPPSGQEVCRNFLKGKCKLGSNCHRSHTGIRDTGAHVPSVPMPIDTAGLKYAKGVVKSWNDATGFGIITPHGGGDDIFVHRNVLGDLDTLEKGSSVLFDAAMDEKRGLFCRSVIASPCAEMGGQVPGVVKAWLQEKGFGFIIPDGGGDDIFVHKLDIANRDMLEKGWSVLFDVAHDDKGQRAINVIVTRFGKNGLMPGVVKSWNDVKGFGFITPDGGGVDVFANKKVLVDCKILETGSSVMFDAVENEDKGNKKATKVVVGALPRPRLDTGGMMQGVVKFWSQEKGFGFLTPDHGGDDVFVHRGVLDGSMLEKGASVFFLAVEDEKAGSGESRFVATQVVGASGAPPRAPPVGAPPAGLHAIPVGAHPQDYMQTAPHVPTRPPAPPPPPPPLTRSTRPPAPPHPSLPPAPPHPSPPVHPLQTMPMYPNPNPSFYPHQPMYPNPNPSFYPPQPMYPTGNRAGEQAAKPSAAPVRPSAKPASDDDADEDYYYDSDD